MRYLVWILRLAVFVVVLMFALKNTGPVTVNFFADHVMAGVPLIVVMLVAFILGIAFGFLVALPAVMRKRRESARLRRDISRLEEQLRSPASRTESAPPETTAPLAPL